MRADEEGKACQKFEALLEDYLSGELPGGAAERVAEHLGACPACREALEEAQISVRLVRPLYEAAEEPGPDFTRRVMAQIYAAEQWMREQRNFWRPLEALSWRLVFSAALALVFLFAYDLRTNGTGRPAGVTTVSAQQNDIFAAPAPAPLSGDETLLAIAEKQHGR